MRALLRLWNGIQGLFRRNVADKELDAELSAFLETRSREHARRDEPRGGHSRLTANTCLHTICS